MKINNIKKKIIFMIEIFIAFSLLLFMLLRFPIIKKLFPIYTYKGFSCIIITAICLIFFLLYIKKYKIVDIDFKDIIISILIFLLVHLLAFGMIATTIDRSFSVFLLNQISISNNQTITLEETKKLFIDKYVENHRAFEKRFDEQIAIGTVVETSENEYKMTNKGNMIVMLFKIFNSIYNIQSELL